MPTMNLDINDAVELAELLQFLHDWLGADPGRLSESLNDFAGSSAYDLVDLRTDLNRFTFLLGTGDAEGSAPKPSGAATDPTPDSSDLS